MNRTGVIRRVDDLGRIILPKEVRRKLGIKEDTPMLIFISDEGVTLKKYYPVDELLDMARSLMDSVENVCADLGPEKIEDIRRYIREIEKLLKRGNCHGPELIRRED